MCGETSSKWGTFPSEAFHARSQRPLLLLSKIQDTALTPRSSPMLTSMGTMLRSHSSMLSTSPPKKSSVTTAEERGISGFSVPHKAGR
eukprot:scaffold3741_cov114-Isochrysis_galbana.AAC.5